MKLVLVEWFDSRRGEGWTLLEDIRNGHGVIKCKSVGWLIAKDSSSLTLAGHLGENPEQCCGDMTIPTAAIQSITQLRAYRKTSA